MTPLIVKTLPICLILLIVFTNAFTEPPSCKTKQISDTLIARTCSYISVQLQQPHKNFSRTLDYNYTLGFFDLLNRCLFANISLDERNACNVERASAENSLCYYSARYRDITLCLDRDYNVMSGVIDDKLINLKYREINELYWTIKMMCIQEDF